MPQTSNDNRIQVEGVAKRFSLRSARAGDLRERFSSLGSLLTRGRSFDTVPTGEFWALKDVSFSIAPGESVGIIGHNGSGKSTLLKMLTGILQPTTGHIATRGRIGALIEVGAGFHPDLSGRENVFLNGSILGLSRREIAGKFDQIVDFAGLEKFIDTPVKRYSSGMYMRLGFSVAAHLDPEILLVDEVLAVGDLFFQNKCLRHLKEFVKQGGTVVFVSHATSQVETFCQRCLWLDHGHLLLDAPPNEAIAQYTAMVTEREDEEFKRHHPAEWELRQREEQERKEREEKERREAEERERREAEERDAKERSEYEIRSRREDEKQERERARLADPDRHALTVCRLLNRDGKPISEIEVGEGLQVEIGYRFASRPPYPVFCLEIFRDDGLYMFATNTYLHGTDTKHLPLSGTVVMDVPSLPLNAGRYRIQLHLFLDCTGDDFPIRVPCEHKVENAATFEVTPGEFGGYGSTYLSVAWRTENTRMPASVALNRNGHSLEETLS